MAGKPTADHAITTNDLHSAAGDNTFSGVMSFMRRKYTKDVTGADVAVWGSTLR